MPFRLYQSSIMRKTFTKEERLCSKRDIDSLFHSGSSFVVYPFRVVYSVISSEAMDAKVILSVSKKRFRRAHDRNRIKRLMREVYRLHKAEVLYPDLIDRSLSIHYAIQYIAKEELSFNYLEERMIKVLKHLKTLV